MEIEQRVKQPFFIILLLVLAGETVFILPFVLARIFRPTFLDVFGLTNYELGICFSIYGLVALVSYLFGGALADKVKPNILMSSALILTALGGFFMATYPTYDTLKIIFGYWGFTTIFLFWSAMIKATRMWGGTKRQGLAFGFLDGGRGLVAAGIGTVGILIFALFTDIDLSRATTAESQIAFRYVIQFSSILVAFIGVLVFFFLKIKQMPGSDNEIFSGKASWSKLKEVLKIPSVLWLSIIILCGYVGYKITDDFSLYAHEVMGLNQVDSAKVGAFLLYIRPIAGISIGLLADRTSPSKWLIRGFALMFFGALLFSSGWIQINFFWIFILSIFVTAIGIYAIRTLYFAALAEGNIPIALTGTAVGLISFVGYTPDIFMGPLMGKLLDDSPGIVGHQHVFILLSAFALLGLWASVRFRKFVVK